MLKYSTVLLPILFLVGNTLSAKVYVEEIETLPQLETIKTEEKITLRDSLSYFEDKLDNYFIFTLTDTKLGNEIYLQREDIESFHPKEVDDVLIFLTKKIPDYVFSIKKRNKVSNNTTFVVIKAKEVERPLTKQTIKAVSPKRILSAINKDENIENITKERWTEVLYSPLSKKIKNPQLFIKKYIKYIAPKNKVLLAYVKEKKKSIDDFKKLVSLSNKSSKKEIFDMYQYFRFDKKLHYVPLELAKKFVSKFDSNIYYTDDIIRDMQKASSQESIQKIYKDLQNQ